MNTTFVNNHDQSLILRFAKNILFIPLVRCLPVSLKPNVLTVFGFISVLFFCHFTTMALQGTHIAFLFAGFALFMYLIADNIDGMHARNTGQTSELGGFLDQWLDGISFLFITMALCSVAHVTHGRALIIMLLMSFVNYILYYEQKQSGAFYKPAFGPNEFLLSIIVVYVFIFFFRIRMVALFHQTGLRNTNVLAYATIVVSIIYIFQTLMKIRIAMRDCIVAALCHCVVLVPYFMHRINSPLIIALLMITINSLFVARILFSIYSIPLFGQPFPSLSMLQLPGIKTAGVRTKKERPSEKLPQ